MADRSEQLVLDGHYGTIAYVLKGFPHLSETFIASEIYRMERAGLRLRLYVIKPSDVGCATGWLARFGPSPFMRPRILSFGPERFFGCWVCHFGDFRPYV